MIKNTLEMQLASVNNFARELGLELVETDGRPSYYGFKQQISFNTMVQWHNGSFPRTSIFSSSWFRTATFRICNALQLLDEYLQIPDEQLDIILEKVERAYDARLVKTARLQWSKRKKQILITSHIVTLNF